MLILLAVIFAVILIVGVVFNYAAAYFHNHYSDCGRKKWYNFGCFVSRGDFEEIFVCVGAIGLSITLFATLCVGIAVSNSMVIDEKITMHEEENATINDQVNVIVAEYKEHELQVFDSAKEDISPMVVFSLYPELKSNTLVEKQIQTYMDNQTEIKQLKSKKLDYEVCKWWLHF